MKPIGQSHLQQFINFLSEGIKSLKKFANRHVSYISVRRIIPTHILSSAKSFIKKLWMRSVSKPVNPFEKSLEEWVNQGSDAKTKGDETTLFTRDNIKNRITAKEAILACKEQGNKKLSLSGLQLSSLPPCISELTGLEDLDLSGNNLTSLSEEICKLTDLQTLDLKNNSLTSIPDSVYKLTGLKSLLLSGNKLNPNDKLVIPSNCYVDITDTLSPPPK